MTGCNFGVCAKAPYWCCVLSFPFWAVVESLRALCDGNSCPVAGGPVARGVCGVRTHWGHCDRCHGAKDGESLYAKD